MMHTTRVCSKACSVFPAPTAWLQLKTAWLLTACASAQSTHRKSRPHSTEVSTSSLRGKKWNAAFFQTTSRSSTSTFLHSTCCQTNTTLQEILLTQHHDRQYVHECGNSFCLKFLSVKPIQVIPHPPKATMFRMTNLKRQNPLTLAH